jgi:hypothetical protein
MKRAVFRQFNAGAYGWQIAIVDARDANLLNGLALGRSHTDLRFIVDDTLRPGKRIGLATAVARRHVKPPSPDHDCVGFRNGSPCDCRASNLYWATRRQLTAKGNWHFRKQMQRVPAAQKQTAHPGEGAPSAKLAETVG